MADYKGIPTILEAAKRLPNVSFHLVGGWPEDVVRQQERAQALGLTNTTFHGLKPHLEIPPFLWHADVLLLPPSRYHPSALWTSPLKLGEYLASGTPIVASRIPALQSWVTDEEVEFVTPDDPRSLALGIQRILQDPSTARRRSQAGIKKAESLSFERRAESILLKLQLLNSKPLDA
jgi:glycosyltransferase involved in cell wall biosynthesis